MKKFIAFSDCDGTLLFDDYKFSDYTINTVKEIYESANYLIPVTARTLKNLRTIAKQLKIDQLGGIVAGNNGAQIFDFKKDQFILNKTINKEMIAEIFDLYFTEADEEKECKVNFTSENIVYSFGESENTKKWAEIMEQEFKVVRNSIEIIEDIVSITIVTKKGTDLDTYLEHFNQIKKNYGKEYRIDNYHNRVISIAPKDVDKGYAVEVINKYLNNTGQYETYGFGDSYNDFALIAAVDYGVAMQNGLHELKENAYDITEYSNYQDGVARYINEKIINKK
ncbi:HAD-IIB family hydrolase [Mesoplasma melaleucae]|uniref:HAD superfamily hydrolase n=1 Tax=Mesoplasma melaleucae TaxID=81459 RepID=A0A2K8NVK0_9MOLU|nr:HAD-IIB family hydrolase [Mesoplasma melaleucae]ATZ17774.1 HAD superfamily hydrolase [Mesoplasma melaleucae]